MAEKTDTAPASYEGPLSPRGVQILKFAVVGMGIALLAGFGTVLTLMVKRAGQIGKPPVADAARSVTAQPDLLAKLRLDIPAGSTVRSATLQGSILTLVHSSPKGDGILIADLSSGKVLSRIELAPTNAP